MATVAKPCFMTTKQLVLENGAVGHSYAASYLKLKCIWSPSANVKGTVEDIGVVLRYVEAELKTCICAVVVEAHTNIPIDTSVTDKS